MYENSTDNDICAKLGKFHRVCMSNDLKSNRMKMFDINTPVGESVAEYLILDELRGDKYE